MINIWIITLMLGQGIHHYADNGVYASKEKCEAVVSMMHLLHPDDEQVARTECREIEVQQ